MHKRPPPPPPPAKSHCNSNRRLVSRLRSHCERNYTHGRHTELLRVPPPKKINGQPMPAKPLGHFLQIAGPFPRPRTSSLESRDICSAPDLLGKGFWIAGHNNRLPSVSRQWAQSHLRPPWLWHLAGRCNLSASQPDSHIHNRKRSWNTLPLNLAGLHGRTALLCAHVHAWCVRFMFWWRCNTNKTPGICGLIGPHPNSADTHVVLRAYRRDKLILSG